MDHPKDTNSKGQRGLASLSLLSHPEGGCRRTWGADGEAIESRYLGFSALAAVEEVATQLSHALTPKIEAKTGTDP